jgi:hypothetical protein
MSNTCKVKPFEFHLADSRTLSALISHIELIKENYIIKEFHIYFQIAESVIPEIISDREISFFEQAYKSFLNKLDASTPILVHALLVPEHLPFVKSIHSSEQALAYLEKVFNTHSDHPLANIQSWLILSLQQQQDYGSYTYHTIWDYLSWPQIVQENYSLSEDDNTIVEISSRYIKDFLQEEMKFSLAKNEIDQHTFDNGIELLNNILDLLPSLNWEDDFNGDNLDQLTQVFIESIYNQITDRLNQIQVKEEENHQDNLSPVEMSSMLTHFFQLREIEFSQHDSQPTFYFSCSGSSEQWDCYIHYDDLNSSACMYSMLPIFVPKRMRRRMAEFLSRINCNIGTGSFDLDFGNGDVRHKTYLYNSKESVGEDCIEHFIVTNLNAVNAYLPYIKQMVKEHLDPESAISLISI